MRISIDLDDAQARALDRLAKAGRKTRAALIRQAIDDLLAARRATRCDDAFGLWANCKVDGLDYQTKMRNWNDDR